MRRYGFIGKGFDGGHHGLVTQATNPVPPPPPSDGELLFSEGFEDTNLAGRGWYDDPSMVRNTANHIPGSLSSCRYRFLAGATTPTAGVTQRHLFTPTESVYLSTWILYSANWVGSGTPDHPHQFYFLSDLDGDFDGLSQNWLTTYIEDHYVAGEGNHPRLSMQDSNSVNASLGTPPNNLIGVTENRSVGLCNTNGHQEAGYTGDCFFVTGDNYWYSDKILNGPLTSTETTGPNYKNQWNFIECYMKMNSIVGGVSQFDGIIQYWFNGILVIDRNDVQFRTAQHPTLKFKQLIIGPYIGDGSPVDQSFYLDNLRVGTGRLIP